MTIKKYIPKKTKILDKRSEDGGYYEAICDNCQRTYYPKSNKARFCCKDCANIYYKKMGVIGKVKQQKKEIISKDKQSKSVSKNKKVIIPKHKELLKNIPISKKPAREIIREKIAEENKWKKYKIKEGIDFLVRVDNVDKVIFLDHYNNSEIGGGVKTANYMVRKDSSDICAIRKL